MTLGESHGLPSPSIRKGSRAGVLNSLSERPRCHVLVWIFCLLFHHRSHIICCYIQYQWTLIVVTVVHYNHFVVSCIKHSASSSFSICSISNWRKAISYTGFSTWRGPVHQTFQRGTFSRWVFMTEKQTQIIAFPSS